MVPAAAPSEYTARRAAPSGASLVDAIWYHDHWLGVVLIPFAWVYQGIVAIRRWLYRVGLLSGIRLDVPVVIVGNLSVGGTGKTPLVIWLSDWLVTHGYQPGIICRGYKGTARLWPQSVSADSDAAMVGDEAVVLARRTTCPVVAGPDRVAAARHLMSSETCNVIISDDGLQHLALHRDYEIVVMDGERRHGNGRCLPAGPLREPVSRLQTVDLVLTKGDAPASQMSMALALGPCTNMRDDTVQRPLSSFRDVSIHAVAGLGFPERFFAQLEASGLAVERHGFPDHYIYSEDDFNFVGESPVIMTEKDAVKCFEFAGENWWFVPAELSVSQTFQSAWSNGIARIMQKN